MFCFLNLAEPSWKGYVNHGGIWTRRSYSIISGKAVVKAVLIPLKFQKLVKIRKKKKKERSQCKSLYDVSLILSESLTMPSKAQNPGFLFSILFHVTCFKLRFIWIIKCFLKESFYTCLSFFKVNYWCSDKLKRLRIIIFSSPHSGLKKRLLTMVVYLE